MNRGAEARAALEFENRLLTEMARGVAAVRGGHLCAR